MVFQGKNIQGASDLQVRRAERPRHLMMVKAGPAVDAVVDRSLLISRKVIC